MTIVKDNLFPLSTEPLVKGGFEKDPLFKELCPSAEHNPPTAIYIPVGQIYRHVCPCCKKEQVLRPVPISFGG